MITVIFMNDEQIIVEDVKSHMFGEITLHVTAKDNKKYVFPLINVKYIKIEK